MIRIFIDIENTVIDSLFDRNWMPSNIEGIKKGIKAGNKFNITDRLSEIDVPTIVIAGAEDDLTDLDTQRKISDNIMDSELIVFENTKHNILIGRNIEEVLKIINDFMSRLD